MTTAKGSPVILLCDPQPGAPWVLRLTWAWWRICTGSEQWRGRTPALPRPWRRGSVLPSPKRVVRQSDSPLKDMQRCSQNEGTEDHSPSSHSGSNSSMFLQTSLVIAYNKEEKSKGVRTLQVWFRVGFGKTHCDPVSFRISKPTCIRSVTSSKIASVSLLMRHAKNPF